MTQEEFLKSLWFVGADGKGNFCIGDEKLTNVIEMGPDKKVAQHIAGLHNAHLTTETPRKSKSNYREINDGIAQEKETAARFGIRHSLC